MMSLHSGPRRSPISGTAGRTDEELGDHLIFLICQPRSGSTLLQYMLAGHPRIHTLPEPWFMLHLLYALRPNGIAAEYDAGTAYLALSNYLSVSGGGRHLFVESVRAAARELYGYALNSSGKNLFLDKTPRYYLVVNELREVFPQARFVYLVRNPLAVLASILQTLGGDWTALRRLDRMNDLVTAPRNIAGAIGGSRERTAILRYEDLVQDTDATLSRLLQQLDVEDVPGLKRYSAIESALGDSKSVTKHHVPVAEYMDRWKSDLQSPDRQDVAISYLHELGPDLLQQLGYSYEELAHEVAMRHRTWRTGPAGWRWRLLITSDDQIEWWDRMRLSLVHSRQQRGPARTILRASYVALAGHAPRRTSARDHIDRRPV